MLRVELTPAAIGAPPGERVAVTVRIHNEGDQAAAFDLRWVGLDEGGADGPTRSPVLPPGAFADLPFWVEVPLSTASMDLLTAVEVRPAERPGASPVLAELRVGTALPEGLALSVNPQNVRAGGRGRFRVELANRGRRPVSVRLRGEVERGRIRIGRRGTDLVRIAPGQHVQLPASFRGRRPLRGDPRRQLVTVVAQADGPALRAVATLSQPALFGALSRRATAMLVVIALWASLLSGGVAVARRVGGGSGETATGQAGAAGGDGAEGAGAGQPGGTGAEGGTGEGGAGDGAATRGGTKGAPGLLARSDEVTVAVAGYVKLPGDDHSGVTVRLRNVDLGAAGRTGGGRLMEGVDSSSGGKLSPLFVDAAVDDIVGPRFSESAPDGEWGFADLPTPALYEVQFSKPGFTTKSFLVSTGADGKAVSLDVELAPGDGALRGVVTGPAGALGGVDITVTDGDVTYRATTATSGDIGAWALDGLGTPARYLVTATRRGFGAATLAVDLTSGETASNIRIGLSPGVSDLTGAVRFEGEPVGDVRVTATDGDFVRTTTTVTDGVIGTFNLPQLPYPAEYTVTVERAGYVPQTLTVQLGEVPTPLQIDLVRSTALIHGTVTRADGTGLSGVGITVTDGDRTFKSTTTIDPPGTFELDGLPPSTYVVSFSRFEYETASSLITVAAGDRRLLDTRLVAKPRVPLPAAAKLTGTISSGLDGQPLEGAVVEVLNHGPLADGSPARATTNVDGGFGIDGLTLGTYTVRISGPPDPLFEPVTRTVRLGSNTVVSIDVTLQPFGSLIGHVTDPAGAPLEDVDVAVVGLAIGTLSEADGSFAIRAQLSTGSFQATFTKPGFVSTHADFTATVGRTTEITVVMDRNPALRGTITRPTASVATPFAPLGGMDVTAQLLDRNLAPVGAPLVRRSDATTGAYAFDPTELVPGTYQVTAADPASAFLGAGAQLVLARNQDQVLDLALSPRTEVTGRVRYRDNAGAANDVSAATVTGQRLIVGYEPAVGGAQPAPIFVDQASTTTNSTGDWTLDQQVAGTSPYLVTKAGFADATVDVTVDPAAAPAPVETFLTPRPGSISGTITVESSSPPSDRSGFEVTLTVPGTAIAAQHATTAADGSFSFGGLAPGRYALAVARSGFLPEPTPALVRLGTAPDPAATPGEITLAVAEAVRLEPISLRQLAHIRAGAVDATTAAALEGVSVQLDRVAANGATTTLGTRTTSAATPVVVFADLQPGNYRLTFSLADYPTVTVDTTITSFGDASDHSATPMLRFGRITGTVAGSTAGVDAPLVGAKVDAVRSGTVLATTTSGAGGAFTLAGLAAGDYEVRVSVGGFTQDATPAVAGLALGEVRTIGPVHLTAQLGGVEGRVVTDNQAGLQLIGVAVTLGGATSNGLPLAPDPAPVYATVADAQNGDGYFRFDDLDMGTVTLDFVAADHRPLRISVAVQRGQVLDLGQIVLQGDAGGITGTVTWKPAGLASTQGPVPSASVVLMHVVDGRREEIERKSTDANGRFAFSALTNQAYTLSVFGPLDPTDFRAARDLPVVVSGGLVTTRDVTLDAVNRRLTVTVTDRAGAAVVGAQVRLENGPAPAGPSATGAGGTVSFTVPPYLGPTAAGDPAQYSLRVTHADHLDGGGSFAFPPGADLARSVVLDRLARLGGRVLSDPAGSALTSLRVDLAPTAASPGASPATSAPVAADGTFSFDRLLPGEYQVSYRSLSGHTTPAPPAPVTLAANGSATLADATYVKRAQITVDIQGPAGLSGLTFTVTPPPPVGAAASYPDGRTLELDPGVDYTFAVAPVTNQNLAGTTNPSPLSFTPGQTGTAVLPVVGEGTLEFTVRDSGGSVVRNGLTLTTTVDGQVRTATSTGSGNGTRWVLDRLPSGTYPVTATLSGHHPLTVSPSPVVTFGTTTPAITLVKLGEITGKVTAAGSGADFTSPRVTVVATDASTPPVQASNQTNNNARYRISDLAAGTWTLAVDTSALATCSSSSPMVTVVATSGAAITQNLTLTTATTIDVTVDDSSGQAVTGLTTVRLVGPSLAATEVSGSPGVYRFTAVPDGSNFQVSIGGTTTGPRFDVSPCAAASTRTVTFDPSPPPAGGP